MPGNFLAGKISNVSDVTVARTDTGAKGGDLQRCNKNVKARESGGFGGADLLSFSLSIRATFGTAYSGRRVNENMSL